MIDSQLRAVLIALRVGYLRRRYAGFRTSTRKPLLHSEDSLNQQRLVLPAVYRLPAEMSDAVLAFDQFVGGAHLMGSAT